MNKHSRRRDEMMLLGLTSHEDGHHDDRVMGAESSREAGLTPAPFFIFKLAVFEGTKFVGQTLADDAPPLVRWVAKLASR